MTLSSERARQATVFLLGFILRAEKIGARKDLTLSDSGSRKGTESDTNALAMLKMPTDTNPDLTCTERSRSTPPGFASR